MPDVEPLSFCLRLRPADLLHLPPGVDERQHPAAEGPQVALELSDVDDALSDGPNMIALDDLPALIECCLRIRQAVQA